MKKLLILLSTLAISVTYYLSNSVTAFATTTVTLQTSDPKISVNEITGVTIDITSNDVTLGTDLVLTYDPAILKPTAVTLGTVYPTYSDSDLATTDGTLYISGVSDFTQGTTPNGQFARVTFTGIKPGTSSIALAFDPEDSSLSGVIPFDGSDENLLEPPSAPITLTVNSLTTPPWLILALILIIITVTTIFIHSRRRSNQKPPLPSSSPLSP